MEKARSFTINLTPFTGQEGNKARACFQLCVSGKKRGVFFMKKREKEIISNEIRDSVSDRVRAERISI